MITQKPQLTLWVGSGKINPTNEGHYYLCSTTTYSDNRVEFAGCDPPRVRKNKDAPDEVFVQLYVRRVEPEELRLKPTKIEHFVYLGKLKHKDKSETEEPDANTEITNITVTIDYREEENAITQKSLTEEATAPGGTEEQSPEDAAVPTSFDTTSNTSTTSTPTGKKDTP